MQFTHYSDLRSKVLRLIDGDESSQSIATDTLDLLIALGESRVYHGDESVPGLRSRLMETDLSLAVTDNAVTLPTDCLGLVRVQFAGEPPLEYLPEDDLLRRLDAGAGGTPRYYTQQGNTLRFYPEASGTLAGRYVQRPADLKTGGLHATFARHPECFLFAALSEAALFIGEDERLPQWKQLWAGWMASAERTERLQATSGSGLTIRAR